MIPKWVMGRAAGAARSFATAALAAWIAAATGAASAGEDARAEAFDADNRLAAELRLLDCSVGMALDRAIAADLDGYAEAYELAGRAEVMIDVALLDVDRLELQEQGGVEQLIRLEAGLQVARARCRAMLVEARRQFDPDDEASGLAIVGSLADQLDRLDRLDGGAKAAPALVSGASIERLRADLRRHRGQLIVERRRLVDEAEVIASLVDHLCGELKRGAVALRIHGALPTEELDRIRATRDVVDGVLQRVGAAALAAANSAPAIGQPEAAAVRPSPQRPADEITPDVQDVLSRVDRLLGLEP